MEIVGYIIGGLNIFIGVLITVFRKLDDALLSAENIIKIELVSAYKDFSTVSSSESIVQGSNIVIGMLDNASNRLMRIHFSISYNFLKLKWIKWFFDKTLFLIVSSIILVSISMLVGHLIKNMDYQLYKHICIIYIPFIILVFEVSILYFVLRSEKYLKRLSSRYVSKEY